jgi:hypothetical protein
VIFFSGEYFLCTSFAGPRGIAVAVSPHWGSTLMRASGRSKSELEKAARPSQARPGWYDGEFGEVIERLSQRQNEIFDARLIIRLADGTTLEIRDFLTDAGRGGLKFYHACAAVGVGAKYEAQQEISATDFVGAVRVKVGIEKKRGYPDRLVVEDYAAPVASAGVVHLRTAGAS